MTGGRPQSPLDRTASPLSAFAADLRALRVSAGGPTYRTMAAQSGVPASSLARTARGLVLPGVGLVRAYVLACGADETEWIARWRAMADREYARRRGLGRDPSGDDAVPPDA